MWNTRINVYISGSFAVHKLSTLLVKWELPITSNAHIHVHKGTCICACDVVCICASHVCTYIFPITHEAFLQWNSSVYTVLINV